jgi:hypothetical protein
MGKIPPNSKLIFDLEIVDFSMPKAGICTRISERMKVACFIPNLIGYSRFALLFLGCYFAFSKD